MNIGFPLSFFISHKASFLIENPTKILSVNFREDKILEFLKLLQTKSLNFVFAMVCNKKKIVFKVNPFKEKVNISFSLDSADKMLLIQAQDNEKILDSFSLNIIDLNFTFEKKRVALIFNFLGKNIELEFLLNEANTLEKLENSNTNSVKSEQAIKNLEIKNDDCNQDKEEGKKRNRKKEENEVEKMKKMINDLKKENNTIFSQINHETVFLFIPILVKIHHSFNFLESA